MAGRRYSSHAGAGVRSDPRRSVGSAILGIIGEVLLTLAVVTALYIVWQLWWTGVESEQAQADQRGSVSWVDPAADGERYKIAKPQSGNPPVQPDQASEGDLIAQLYIPRFGSSWHRNVVEGTDAYQLSRHGLGHYKESQMPGELGNVAIAGHRSGYGEPLAHVDTFQSGDKIIIRTKDYWYVYHYTSHEIVLPTETDVVASVPRHPGEAPTKRYITLTTCEPRYTTPTHRWISYGEFDYWAKVSDGIPQELSDSAASGAVQFSQQPSLLARVSSAIPQLLLALGIAYVVIYLSALIAWHYPVLRMIKDGRRRAPSVSMWGWLYRHQPGPAAIRWLLLAIIVLAAAAVLLEWTFPWMASNIPYLKVTSNFVAVE